MAYAQRSHDYIATVIATCKESIEEALHVGDSETAQLEYALAYDSIKQEDSTCRWRSSLWALPIGGLAGALATSLFLGVAVALAAAAVIHHVASPAKKWTPELDELKTMSEREAVWLQE